MSGEDAAKLFEERVLTFDPPPIPRMVCRKVPRTYAMVSKQKCVFSDGCHDVHGRLYFGVGRKSSHTRDISNLAIRLGDQVSKALPLFDVDAFLTTCTQKVRRYSCGCIKTEEFVQCNRRVDSNIRCARARREFLPDKRHYCQMHLVLAGTECARLTPAVVADTCLFQ